MKAWSAAIISALSSRTIRRAATRCPPATIRSARVWPDLSSAAVRVSETVRTAILTARKGRVSSILGMATIRLPDIERGIGRPPSGGKRVEIGRRLAQPLAIDPIICQHALGEDARLLHRNALD